MTAAWRSSRQRASPFRMGRICACAIAVATLTAACEPIEPQPPRSELRLMMHPAQNTRFGDTLKNALQRALPEMDITIREEIREPEIAAALQDGLADVAFAYADVAHLAYFGRMDGRRFDQLRGIATLNTNPVYVLVRRDSTIRDMDDLTGRRVNVGPMGSVTALSVQVALEAFGNDIEKSYEPFQDSIAMLADGRLDATFVVGGYPLEGLREAVTTGGARILSLSETTRRLLRRTYPFVLPFVIPRGVYGPEAILTIGIERLLICRDGLDREVVYRVTQAFFESLPKLSASDPQLRQMNVENAQATPVPLHEGAARYYREQEQM